jgi:hypothetical protein
VTAIPAVQLLRRITAAHTHIRSGRRPRPKTAPSRRQVSRRFS